MTSGVACADVGMLDILAEGNTTGVNIIASKANTLPAGPRTTDDLPPAGKFAYASLTAEQREMLSTLPPKIELEPGILAVHGTPTDDSTYLLEETAGDKLVPRVASLRSRGSARMPPQMSCFAAIATISSCG